MTWADGSVYKGCWQNAIQSGLGLMTFANGVRKAGIFKDNVLVELISDISCIGVQEAITGKLPAEFKLEIEEYLRSIAGKPAQTEAYLYQKLQKMQPEDKQEPNTLLKMQDMPNVPWGGSTSKDQYI